MKAKIGVALLFILPFLLNLRYLSISYLDILAALSFIAVAVFYFDKNIFKYKKYTTGFYSLLIIIVFTSISVLRSYDNSFITNFKHTAIILFYSLGTVFLLFYFRYRMKALNSLMLGTVFYLITVLLMTYLFLGDGLINYFGNFSLAHDSEIRNEKFQLVFSTSSVNHFGVMVGTVLLFFFMKFRNDKRTSTFILVVILSILLVLTKNRTSIIAILILSILVLIRKEQLVFLKYFIVAIPVIPIIITNTSILLNFFETFDLVSDKNDFLTFNNRHIIWNSILIDFSSFKIEHLIGYGGHGNLNISENSYLFLFSGEMNETLEKGTSHNAYLQILTDMGYLVFGYFLFFIFISVKKAIDYANEGSMSMRIITVVIIFLMISGSTEALFGNYYLYNYILLLACLAMVNFETTLTDSEYLQYYRMMMFEKNKLPVRGIK